MMVFNETLREYVDSAILDTPINGNLAIDYIIAFIVFLIALALLKVFKFIVLVKLRAIAKNTRNDIDDTILKVIDSFGWTFYIVLSLYIAFQFIVLDPFIEGIMIYVLYIVTGYFLIRAAGIVIDYAAMKILDGNKDNVDNSVVSLIVQISKFSLWIIVALLIISNLGYEISALLTGLGIGGIAIALALQTVLSDVFAYFSIHLDKPFRVGDFIVVGSDAGIVQKIGIKSTRIRTLQGQELVVSNQELTSSRINNYKRMKERRIIFTIGVSHSTPTAKLKKIPGILRKIIESAELTRFDRAHFMRFDSSALIYEVVYYVDTPNYNKYMDIQQEINLGIKEHFEKNGITIPFPTQTVHVAK
ncbi:mechanosensitive ion channel family protein [Candidatus Micrarchaeota archaeon]|nr:mechanosensitive ion channel family protein [Candidatus Micrarchaeota archaeon]